MGSPVEGFENKTKLLSEDEKQLVGVLHSFYEAIEDLRHRVAELEEAQGVSVRD